MTLDKSRASLVAQKVKNPPAVQQSQVQYLVWKDPLEKEMATHSTIPAWKTPRTEKPGSIWGSKELDTTERLTLSLSVGQITSPLWASEVQSNAITIYLFLSVG